MPLRIQFMCTHVLHLEQPPKCLITTASQDLLWYYRRANNERGPAAAYLASSAATVNGILPSAALPSRFQAHC